MSRWPNHPVIYEINTWPWLTDLSRETERAVTLGNVPQAELEKLAGYGFDAVWLMGVWQRSPTSRKIARSMPALQAEYSKALPDYTQDDVVGSPYAVYGYQVDENLGGDEELAGLRQRLNDLGLRLILDFVPNHLAVDHAWVKEHPQRFVRTSLGDLSEVPSDYFQAHGRVFAHGRDPYYAGWTDTAQLDYRRPETRQAMTDTLLGVAERCDGVRCDMAMLVTHDVFIRTWGGAFDPPKTEFWPEAIAAVTSAHPGFLMLAEVYWDMEYALQQLGFDYTYDKRLYDRLAGGDTGLVRDHLALANLEYQRHLVRFIENHDEKRAIQVFGPLGSQAVAAAALTLPGARLLHEGQIEGRRSKLPVQLGRRSLEPTEPGMEPFYGKLLKALSAPVFHNGHWRFLEPREEWSGNPSYRNFLAHLWLLGAEQRLVAANLAAEPSQCFIPLDLPELTGKTWELKDLLSGIRYERDGDALLERGLYLNLPGYGFHLCELQALE